MWIIWSCGQLPYRILESDPSASVKIQSMQNTFLFKCCLRKGTDGGERCTEHNDKNEITGAIELMVMMGVLVIVCVNGSASLLDTIELITEMICCTT